MNNQKLLICIFSALCIFLSGCAPTPVRTEASVDIKKLPEKEQNQIIFLYLCAEAYRVSAFAVEEKEQRDYFSSQQHALEEGLKNKFGIQKLHEIAAHDFLVEQMKKARTPDDPGGAQKFLVETVKSCPVFKTN